MTAHLRLNTSELQRGIRQHKIKFAGNLKLKIYGTLRCASGKRMKKENRVFFKNEKEAIKEGFRPCGHCMRKSFLDWKAKQNDIALR
jgi:methylphosphotriester-DNA--protein-cysteine methyltransferase